MSQSLGSGSFDNLSALLDNSETMSVELLTQLLHRAATRPDARAVIECRWSSEGADRVQMASWTYAELAAAIANRAQWFVDQTPEDGVILLALPNGFDFTATFLAVLAAGRTIFPVSGQLAPAELILAARKAGVSVAFVPDVQTTPLSEINGIQCHDIGTWAGAVDKGAMFDPEPARSSGMYLLSSGTTAMPRIVDRRADALDAVARNIAHQVGGANHPRLLPEDRVLAVIPQCHSYGVESALMGPIHAGACLVLCQGFDPLLVRELWRRGHVSVFPATPTMLDMLARMGGTATSPGDDGVRSQPCVYSAGAILPASVVRAFEQRFGASIGQLYGASEAGSVTFISGDERPDPTCVGLPFPEINVRIVEPDGEHLTDVSAGAEGEVVIRAPSMFSRYVGDRDDCTTDGYWRSGDLGRYDAQGKLHITGRLKLLIDVGPEKVNPLEVESALRDHPAVAECVVKPVPVTETVCRLRAVVVVAAGAAATAEELRLFLRDRLSAYKVPRVFEFRTDFPRSATGKVLRREI